ncbi:MAG: adaptor protein MecA [Lachnospiraceae bacterium]|nr:adaptor protein MecA [Lachnospiraceae bacterium]
MEFERIGKNTVQCHMTVEEMNDYGLRIEDFFTNQEKSRNFLEQLVERAEEEIGYEVETGMISMQLMRMPDDSLVITFSDKGEDGLHNMLNQLQNLAGMLDEGTAESIVDAMSKEVGETSEEIYDEENLQEAGENTQRTYPKRREAKQQGKRRKNTVSSRVYRFEGLDMLENFACTLQIGKNISSRLYKNKAGGEWYLLVKKGKLKLDEYQVICQQLSEYGMLCVKQPFMEQYCKEHYDCVIGKQALRVIKEYAS